MVPRDPAASAVIEAERALQVVNVLQRMERKIDEGHWARGRRFGPSGDICLVGALDESTRWTMPEAREAVTAELVAELPAALRIVALWKPRIALMTYNDAPGGRRRTRLMISRALERLGGRSAPIAPAETPAGLGARVWSAERARGRHRPRVGDR